MLTLPRTCAAHFKFHVGRNVLFHDGAYWRYGQIVATAAGFRQTYKVKSENVFYTEFRTIHLIPEECYD